MPSVDEQSLPFLTRDMLAFKHGLRFQLRIDTHSFASGSIFIIGFTREGTFKFSHTPNTDSLVKTETFQIPDMPIMVSVIDGSGIREQGQTYAQLNLVINGDILHQLTSGYVYGRKGLSWPLSNVQDMRPGGGALVGRQSSNPAAGAELSHLIPQGQQWRIRGMSFTLVTDATVVDRTVHILVSAGGGASYDFIAPVVQPASETKLYTCYPASVGGQTNGGNDIHIPIPPDFLLPTLSTIATETTNLQAGDNFGVMTFDLEMFFDAL